MFFIRDDNAFSSSALIAVQTMTLQEL